MKHLGIFFSKNYLPMPAKIKLQCHKLRSCTKLCRCLWMLSIAIHLAPLSVPCHRNLIKLATVAAFMLVSLFVEKYKGRDKLIFCHRRYFFGAKMKTELTFFGSKRGFAKISRLTIFCFRFRFTSNFGRRFSVWFDEFRLSSDKSRRRRRR